MNKFNPQPLEQLKARYQKAIKDTYIQLDVARGAQSKPGKNSKHVFDFLDGVRLVISREKCPDDRLVIHISGSVWVYSEAEGMKLIQVMHDKNCWHIIEHWKLLTDLDSTLEVVGIQNNILHLYLRLDN